MTLGFFCDNEGLGFVYIFVVVGGGLSFLSVCVLASVPMMF